jgi:hypothetical protein
MFLVSGFCINNWFVVDSAQQALLQGMGNKASTRHSTGRWHTIILNKICKVHMNVVKFIKSGLSEQ